MWYGESGGDTVDEPLHLPLILAALSWPALSKNAEEKHLAVT